MNCARSCSQMEQPNAPTEVLFPLLKIYPQGGHGHRPPEIQERGSTTIPRDWLTTERSEGTQDTGKGLGPTRQRCRGLGSPKGNPGVMPELLHELRWTKTGLLHRWGGRLQETNPFPSLPHPLTVLKARRGGKNQVTRTQRGKTSVAL